ncbi:hypothetical protein [Bacillus rubiinfantis]|uniref:hypothetical protein n=1 Tax=Bacillus rubiinfantis TaxID=1499680 RepID=UPI000A7FA6EC|nr:hypothetical protein [Bacillus rubiinfantis]
MTKVLQCFLVHFTEEFNKCLDQIQTFFAEQGEDVLEWWYSKEDNMIDEMDVSLTIHVRISFLCSM